MIKFIINGSEIELEKYNVYEYFTKLNKDSVVTTEDINEVKDIVEFLPCISDRCFGTLAGIKINTQ